MSAPTHPNRTHETHAETNGSGVGEIHTKHAVIRFDSAPTESDELPGPVDLLTSAFAACIIENVERTGELLPFAFDLASVEVSAERQDRSPGVVRITYVVTVVTDEPPHRVDLLHRQIQRQGATFNTLARACEVSGTIKALPSR